MSSSTDDRLAVGRIGKPHGVKGEVTIEPFSDDPNRFGEGARFLTDQDPPRVLQIQRTRAHQGRLLIKFVDIDDRNAAEGLRGVRMTIALDERRALSDDEFWPEDLEGLVALGPDGSRLGVVESVVLAEHQDRLAVLTDDGRRVEVPFVAEFVGEVHPSGGFVVVTPPLGLFEES